ncbi:conserved hypothetical protein [Aspergillus fumigatus A1163]|uniref:Uncharacterized protein n=1 Tax=Aspergillus fumigatus (strain CBS 144.89 / FGSC A1163 / CEA10) TaxID=451804 RepID=B0XU89_ASPFC|nr:conserved hypothetical protein [Aspergillus fumigatus A1163]
MRTRNFSSMPSGAFIAVPSAFGIRTYVALDILLASGGVSLFAVEAFPAVVGLYQHVLRTHNLIPLLELCDGITGLNNNTGEFMAHDKSRARRLNATVRMKVATTPRLN